MVINFNAWLMATIGGILMGVGAGMLLLFSGRVAGISGVFGGILTVPKGDTLWRILFVLGMVLGGVILYFAVPEAFATSYSRSFGAMGLAGFLVGFGARMGNGCTSGHGICGIGRLSPRSIVAVSAFIIFGAIAVAVVRYGFGGTI